MNILTRLLKAIIQHEADPEGAAASVKGLVDIIHDSPYPEADIQRAIWEERPIHFRYPKHGDGPLEGRIVSPVEVQELRSTVLLGWDHYAGDWRKFCLRKMDPLTIGPASAYTTEPDYEGACDR